jgi:hypothetical protein
MGDATAKVSGIPFGVLLAKEGDTGQPVQAGPCRNFKSGDKTVYVAVNDSDFSNNHGSYVVRRK